MPVSNPAAALGEAVGKLIENRITSVLASATVPKGYLAGPSRIVNGAGTVYQIDCIVSAPDGSPLIIIDPKYIRYTKHNRDKGSWLCVAHYNLRKTFPTIRKSIAILAGRWSKPSVALIKSFGVEVFEVPFPFFVTALRKRGVDFDWEENNRPAAAKAWESFSGLTNIQKLQIMDEITAELLPPLRKEVL